MKTLIIVNESGSLCYPTWHCLVAFTIFLSPRILHLNKSLSVNIGDSESVNSVTGNQNTMNIVIASKLHRHSKRCIKNGWLTWFPRILLRLCMSYLAPQVKNPLTLAEATIQGNWVGMNLHGMSPIWSAWGTKENLHCDAQNVVYNSCVRCTIPLVHIY